MKIVLSAKQGVLEVLYRATREPIGLKVSFEGVPFKTARQWFYVAMRRNAPEFDHLVLVNMDEELWIVRSDAEELKNVQVKRTSDQAYDAPDGGIV